MLASTLLGLTLAAIPGTPEPATPGWHNDSVHVTWLNDSWGWGQHPPDDLRTNAFTVVMRRREWAVVVDHAILTDMPKVRAPSRTGDRIDEGIVTIGRLYPGPSMEASAGLGVRFQGNLGGQDLQNWWHARGAGGDHMDGQYGHDSFDGVMYGLWTGHWRCLAGTVSGLVSTAGEYSGDVALTLFGETTRRVDWRDDALGAWLGLRAQHRGGRAPNTVAATVADYETGLFVEFGITMAHYAAYTWQGGVDGRGATGAFHAIIRF